jgi:hypothetical protein
MGHAAAGLTNRASLVRFGYQVFRCPRPCPFPAIHSEYRLIVSQAARVGQQHANRYFVSLWLFGKPGIDSIIQGEFPFLYQLHNYHRCKGLGNTGYE